MSRRRATLNDAREQQIARMERIRDQARAQQSERTEQMMSPRPESVVFATEEAEQIINEAKAKAEQIVQQAKDEAEARLAPHQCVCGKRFKNAAGLGSHRNTCKEYQNGLRTQRALE